MLFRTAGFLVRAYLGAWAAAASYALLVAGELVSAGKGGIRALLGPAEVVEARVRAGSHTFDRAAERLLPVPLRRAQQWSRGVLHGLRAAASCPHRAMNGKTSEPDPEDLAARRRHIELCMGDLHRYVQSRAAEKSCPNTPRDASRSRTPASSAEDNALLLLAQLQAQLKLVNEEPAVQNGSSAGGFCKKRAAVQTARPH